MWQKHTNPKNILPAPILLPLLQCSKLWRRLKSYNNMMDDNWMRLYFYVLTHWIDGQHMENLRIFELSRLNPHRKSIDAGSLNCFWVGVPTLNPQIHKTDKILRDLKYHLRICPRPWKLDKYREELYITKISCFRSKLFHELKKRINLRTFLWRKLRHHP